MAFHHLIFPFCSGLLVFGKSQRINSSHLVATAVACSRPSLPQPTAPPRMRCVSPLVRWREAPVEVPTAMHFSGNSISSRRDSRQRCRSSLSVIRPSFFFVHKSCFVGVWFSFWKEIRCIYCYILLESLRMLFVLTWTRNSFFLAGRIPLKHMPSRGKNQVCRQIEELSVSLQWQQIPNQLLYEKRQHFAIKSSEKKTSYPNH